MSEVAVEAVSWSNRRWFWTIFLVLTAHFLVVGWLSGQKRAELPSPRVATQIWLGSDAIAQDHVRGLAPVSDPTVFALANAHGFSGEAWLKMQPFPYETTNRLEPPRWLPPASTRLGADFVRFVETNVSVTFHLAEKLPPIFFQVREPVWPARLQVSLVIEGDLARRRLIAAPDLPEADPGAIPTNCVINVKITPDGYSFSPPVVLTSSGSANFDKRASDFAKAARFNPVGTINATNLFQPDGLTLGNLVFKWSLAPGKESNRPPAKLPAP